MNMGQYNLGAISTDHDMSCETSRVDDHICTPSAPILSLDTTIFREPTSDLTNTSPDGLVRY